MFAGSGAVAKVGVAGPNLSTTIFSRKHAIMLEAAPPAIGTAISDQEHHADEPLSREMLLAGLIVFLTCTFSVLYPTSFRSWDNATAILRNLTVDGIVVTGMLLLMVAGSFDLSVGSTLSLTGVLAGWLMKTAGWPVPAAIATALVAATVGGVFNGIMVTVAGVNPLITTLATMGIYQGVAILIGGPGIPFLPEAFCRIGQAEWLGLQAPAWLMLVMAVLAHILLAHTRFFQQYYYIGSNDKAARLSGIRVEPLRVFAFAVMGLVAGLAGVLFAARVGTAVSNAGVGAELRVITAVILGGASLAGGKGTVPGAMLGVAFMALLNNVLIIARVSSYWQGIILGIVLLLAVSLDSYVNRRRS